MKKMDCTICTLRICRNHINTKEKTYGKDDECNICLVIYTPSSLVCKCGIYHLAIFFLLNIYIFATYLQGANLCKSTQIRPVKDQGAR